MNRARYRVAALCLLGACHGPPPEPLELELEYGDMPALPENPPDAHEFTIADAEALNEEHENIDRNCPLVRFAPLGPTVQAGPTAERIQVHIDGRIVDSILDASFTDLVLARHSVEFPGVHFYEALNLASACMMGWSHRNCFVGPEHVYCDGEQDLIAFVRDTGLAKDPKRISKQAWVELVATFARADRLLITPEGVAECLSGVPHAIRARVTPQVTFSEPGVLVQAAVTTRAHEIVITWLRVTDAEVTAGSRVIWTPPEADD